MTDEIERTIDARHLACPLPVLKARKALLALRPGQLVRLLATDPAANRDVPAFLEEQGHELVAVQEELGATVFLIRRGPAG